MVKVRVMTAALCAGLAGLGGGAAAAADDHGHRVEIEGGHFSPAEETIGVGEALTWVHADGAAAHSVTADDGSFDSHPRCTAARSAECMQDGATYTHTFTGVGRYPYHSRPGGKRVAGVVVVVEEADH